MRSCDRGAGSLPLRSVQSVRFDRADSLLTLPPSSKGLLTLRVMGDDSIREVTLSSRARAEWRQEGGRGIG